VILAIDVGNTETVVGLFREGQVPEAPLHAWRFATDPRRTSDEHAFLLRGFLDRYRSPSDEPLRRAVVASVVPSMDRVWAGACRRLNVEHRAVDAGADLPIELDVEDPAGVGPDRIVNTLAADHLYGRDTVVVDLGTATTFDCITGGGVFLGGVIAPGPRAGAEHLGRAASRLPHVEVAEPERVVGRRTEACVNSGVFYSVVDSIDGIVGRVLEEWGPDDPLVVATGGLVDLIAPHCESVERVERHLTLIGIALADRHMA
jgi:type III pantothenate kinase